MWHENWKSRKMQIISKKFCRQSGIEQLSSYLNNIENTILEWNPSLFQMAAKKGVNDLIMFFRGEKGVGTKCLYKRMACSVSNYFHLYKKYLKKSNAIHRIFGLVFIPQISIDCYQTINCLIEFTHTCYTHV